jgi:hypothetical protein
LPAFIEGDEYDACFLVRDDEAYWGLRQPTLGS